MDDQTSDHLRISSPSNTAVKYTISSRTREPAKFVVILRHALRIIVAFYTTLATIAKLQLTFAFEIDQTVEQLLDITLMSGFVRLVMDNAQWWVLCITSLLTLYLCVRRDYTGWWTHLSMDHADLTCCRREFAGLARPWSADFDKLFVFLLESDDYLYTYHADPRYCDS